MHSTRRVVIYARVSTGEQADGVSLDGQVSRGRAWAAYHDATVVDVLVDSGVSGKSMERDGIDRVLELVQDGQVDTVVVSELSRLTRSARDYANVIADLTTAGARVVCINNGLDTSDACGRLMLGMLSYVSEFEREQISERTRAALAQVKAEGRHLGRPPIGFTSEGGELVVSDRARVKLAKRAAAMHRRGTSYRAIAATFNAEGIPTGSGSGSWHAPAVGRLLRAARVSDRVRRSQGRTVRTPGKAVSTR